MRTRRREHTRGRVPTKYRIIARLAPRSLSKRSFCRSSAGPPAHPTAHPPVRLPALSSVRQLDDPYVVAISLAVSFRSPPPSSSTEEELVIRRHPRQLATSAPLQFISVSVSTPPPPLPELGTMRRRTRGIGGGDRKGCRGEANGHRRD